MARKTQEEAEETRTAILEAALDLFSEQGYSATSFSDIAACIGMTRGAVYWHFREKPDLLVELMDKLVGEAEAKVRERVPVVQSFADLRAHLMARTRLLLEDERYRKFVFFLSLQMEWSSETLTFTHKRVKEFQTLPFADLGRFLEEAEERGALREGIDAHAAASVLLGMWKGIVQHHFTGLLGVDLCASVELGLDLFIEGIQRGASAK